MGSASKASEASRYFPWLDTSAKQPVDRVDLPRPKVVAEPIPRLALGIDELAVALGVSPGTVRSWRKNKTGPPNFRTPDGRRILFPISAVEEWLRGQATGTEDDFGGELSHN